MTVARTQNNRLLLAGFALWLILIGPGMSGVLEATLPTHLLLQLPLLAFAGWLIGCDPRVEHHLGRLEWNRYGITGLAVFLLAILFWMIPRFLDASLVDNRMALAKYVTLPLLVGLPLRLSWHLAPFFIKGFLQVNLLSMLIFLAWLYHTAPVQLCNSYQRDDQLILSAFLIKIVFVLSLLFAFKPIFGFSPTQYFNRTTSSIGPFILRLYHGYS